METNCLYDQGHLLWQKLSKSKVQKTVSFYGFTHCHRESLRLINFNPSNIAKIGVLYLSPNIFDAKFLLYLELKDGGQFFYDCSSFKILFPTSLWGNEKRYSPIFSHIEKIPYLTNELIELPVTYIKLKLSRLEVNSLMRTIMNDYWYFKTSSYLKCDYRIPASILKSLGSRFIHITHFLSYLKVNKYVLEEVTTTLERLMTNYMGMTDLQPSEFYKKQTPFEIKELYHDKENLSEKYLLEELYQCFDFDRFQAIQSMVNNKVNEAEILSYLNSEKEIIEIWRGMRDSNSRPTGSKPATLSS